MSYNLRLYFIVTKLHEEIAAKTIFPFTADSNLYMKGEFTMQETIIYLRGNGRNEIKGVPLVLEQLFKTYSYAKENKLTVNKVFIDEIQSLDEPTPQFDEMVMYLKEKINSINQKILVLTPLEAVLRLDNGGVLNELEAKGLTIELALFQ